MEGKIRVDAPNIESHLTWLREMNLEINHSFLKAESKSFPKQFGGKVF